MASLLNLAYTSASPLTLSGSYPSTTPCFFSLHRRSRRPVTLCKAEAANQLQDVPDIVGTPAEELIPWLPSGLHKSKFPKDFVFGAASSAFQFEGALDVDGRKPSIWDEWVKVEGKIKDGSSPDITAGQYYHYKEHVKLIKSMGLNAYRISISWPRVIDPDTGEPNPKGLEYYKNFIGELKANGIEPFVTLYHWDLPQAYQNGPTYGWLSKDGTIVKEFVKFAEVCFKELGGMVKKWMTLNEPWSCVYMGYVDDKFPPGVSDTEDPTRDPYTAAHNMLLAHAAVVEIYRTKYKEKQKGEIGITLSSQWPEPLFDTTHDTHAAQRYLDFELGWFLHPIAYGKYPDTMEKRVGDRLPKFTDEESRKLKGSMDFLGLNYYSSVYVREFKFNPYVGAPKPGYHADMRITQLYEQSALVENSGVLIGPFPPNLTWEDRAPPLVPWGFFKLLKYIDAKYKIPKIYITENGARMKYEEGDVEKNKNDDFRIKALFCHLENLRSAVDAGMNISGYFSWALLDNWEWDHGYTHCFGHIMVDKSNPDLFLPTEKKSAKLLRAFLKT